MAEENDANKANFAEINGHIDILKAKLNQALGTPQNERAANIQEDLTDYYERAIQDRIMRNTTLEAQLVERNKEFYCINEKYRKINVQRIIALAIAFMAVAVAAMEAIVPGLLTKLGNGVPVTQIASYVIVAALGALVRSRYV